MDKLTVGQLAKRTGVSAIAIRHYERIGLLPAPMRDHNGYRLYSKNVVKKVRFILNAKEAGFTLKEIFDLFKTQHNKDSASGDIRQFVITKSAEVRDRIELLKKFANTLDKLANSCDGKVPISQCPILELLYTENEEINLND